MDFDMKKKSALVIMKSGKTYNERNRIAESEKNQYIWMRGK